MAENLKVRQVVAPKSYLLDNNLGGAWVGSGLVRCGVAG